MTKSRITLPIEKTLPLVIIGQSGRVVVLQLFAKPVCERVNASTTSYVQALLHVTRTCKFFRAARHATRGLTKPRLSPYPFPAN
jgi:hypothetical protein